LGQWALLAGVGNDQRHRYFNIQNKRMIIG
jgi:hypothetical protein